MGGGGLGERSPAPPTPTLTLHTQRVEEGPLTSWKPWQIFVKSHPPDYVIKES